MSTRRLELVGERIVGWVVGAVLVWNLGLELEWLIPSAAAFTWISALELGWLVQKVADKWI